MGCRWYARLDGERQAGIPVAHTSRVSSHAFSSQNDFDHAGAVVCDSTRCSHLRACMGAVTDQKANATLTVLDLRDNSVGDGGAAALANALKATVFDVQEVCVRCHRKCRCTKSSEELASSTCCAACVAAFVEFFLWFEGRSLFMSVSQKLCSGSHVDVAECQNETGLIEF